MSETTPDQAPIAELEYTPSAFEQAIIKHKSKLILLGVLATIGCIGYYGTKFARDAAAEKAGQAFYKASSIDDYRTVAKDHAGKVAGGNAQYMVAQLLLEDNRGEDAIKEFEAFLKDYPKNDLVEQARLRSADASLQKGDRATAITKYQEFVDRAEHKDSIYRPLAMERLADTLASEKRLDEARKMFERLKSENPGKQFGRESVQDKANTKLEMLDMEEPVKIPFKEDPPPATATVPGFPGAPNIGIPSLTAPGLSLDAPGLNLDPGAAPAGEPTLKLDSPVPAPAPGPTPVPVPLPTGTPATAPTITPVPAPPTPPVPVPAVPAPAKPAPAVPIPAAPAPTTPK